MGLPPTDVGLGNTVWVCDGWLMELRQGGGGPNYAGTAELYLTVEDEAASDAKLAAKP